MTDTVSKKKRSQIMKANKPKDNKSTELKLIQLFKQLGLKGWRRNYKIAVAHPDFVFLEKKIAVFADGCFWHGHNCRNLTPEQNSEYWQKKLENNRIRDKQINERLEGKGWEVIRVWECEIKEQKKATLKLMNSQKTKNSGGTTNQPIVVN